MKSIRQKTLFPLAAVLLTLLFSNCTQQPLPEIGKWEIFESSVQNDNSYANPFADVSLGISYTRPDGSVVDFRGFYDGEGTWKYRFMPDMTGTWTYRGRFTDGSGTVKGSFNCVESGLKGMPVRYGPNPIWFGFSGGQPYYVKSFHVGDRFTADRINSVTGSPWSPAQRTAFLDWVEDQGYNMLSVASCLLNRESEGRGLGWDTPDLWDSRQQQPDPDEFERLEAILDELARRDIVLFPFAGFIGRDSDILAQPENWKRFIDYALARIAPYRNLILSVGGPEPILAHRPYMTYEQVMETGSYIRERDVFGHLLSVHNETGDDPFRAADWLSYTTLQGPKTRDRAQLGHGLLRTSHPSKPMYAQETLWPGNKNHPVYDLEDIRKNGLVTMMSAAMINFIDNDGNSSSGFTGSLNLEDRHQEWHDAMHQVWDFFERFNWHEMTPRQDLVNNGHCLANPGKEYLVYLPEGGEVRVRVIRGDDNYTVHYWDPSSPDAPQKTAETGNGRGLEPPAGGDDWMVHIFRD